MTAPGRIMQKTPIIGNIRSDRHNGTESDYFGRKPQRRQDSHFLPVLPGRAFLNALIPAVIAGSIMTPQRSFATVCHVPAALLCEGCVERLSFRVRGDGVCWISFARVAADAAPSAKFVDINIETEPPGTLRHRVNPARRPVDKLATPLRPTAACFAFNGRRFCE